MDLFYKSFQSLLNRSSKDIQFEDLISPPDDLHAEQLYQSFVKIWNEKKNLPVGRVPILWTVLHKLIFNQFWYAGFCRLVSDVLVLIGPILIELVVRSAQNSDRQGVFWYSTYLFISSFFQALFLQQFIEASFLCGAKVTNTATTAVYFSSLQLKLQQIYPPKSIGEINNVQSKDAASLREFVVFSHNLWSCPLTILGCVYFIFRLLGFVGLISVVILLLFIPLESFVADKSRTNKKAVSKLSDSRMSLIYELIDGIKTLKLTGLRDIIQNRISKVRNDELSRAWKGRMLDASNLVISRFVPVIVIALTFGLYLISPESTLDAPTVFATLSLINIMARPINVIPKCISLLSGCLVSLKRIEDVLRLSEISDISELQSCQNNYTSTASVQLTNVTVVRQKTDGTCTTPLHNINCLLHGTRLVMVVGDNGSGKTTFLHAILKEAPLSPESHVTISEITNGRTNYNPRIAYVGHDAWILRDTVRKNIVIGDLDFISQGFVDESRYQHVIRLCCLDEDIQRWPNGDLTVVGEKGVTISGGQKARVSLARAIYSRAPILILDSPLAGLDKEVARQVFFEAIKKTAETRLVIMATHRLDLLSYSDYIIVLQNGSIIFDGTYQDMNISAATQNALVQIKNHHIESEVVGTTGNIAIERGRTGMISFFISIGNLKSQKAVPGEYEQLLVASGVDTGTSGETLWQLFLEYCRACGIFGSFLGILLSFTSYGLSAWSDWMLSYLADSPTRQAQNHFFQLFLFFSFLVLLNNISRYALMAYSGITGSKQLHNALTSSIISAPLLFFDAIPSGRIISRFSSDMDTIDNDIPSSLSSSYDAFLGVITGLLVVIIKSPIFLILVFPLGFQYQMIQKMYRKASVELKRLDSSSKSPVFSHFNETLAGLEYIRAYQLQSIMIRQHQDYLNRSISTRYNWDGVNRWLGIRLDLIGALIVSGAAYSLLFLETNSSNGGSAGLMVTYALKSTASLSFVVRSSTALENMMLSLSRVLEFIRIPSELESIPTSPSSSTKLYQNEDYHDDGDIESVPLIKQNQQNYLDKPIHLIGRDVTVSYHRTLPPVLKNVNFQLIGGKIIGLCGRTGGGKSTLAKVIARVIANENPPQQISFNNHSIYSIPLYQYRKDCVNLFPQDSYLFSGTIRDVVDPHHHFSPQVILGQLQRFSHVILSEDNSSSMDSLTSSSHLLNLNYEITSNGGNISAGEKQILTLVRASLCEARIVILDEITSNMSIPAAEISLKMLRADLIEKKQSGIILICHRPEDMALCDQIWEIIDGRLTEK